MTVHKDDSIATMSNDKTTGTPSVATGTGTMTATTTIPRNPLRKLILTRDDLAYFHNEHPLYAERLVPFVEALGESVKGLRTTDTASIPRSPFIDRWMNHVMTPLHELPSRFPPLTHYAAQDAPGAGASSSSRFGNPAFRQFYDEVARSAEAMVLHALENMHGDAGDKNDTVTSGNTMTSATRALAASEISGYLRESFGDRTRIDYGTGHELHFICALLALHQLGVIGKEDFPAVVLVVFVEYLKVMRRLQFDYWLEPAGSHGVWGLDDYHFLPFLFGASQLVGHKHLRPRSIHDQEIITAYANDYLYFGCIQFINSVKTASLAWHSPMLNDISAVKTWDKVASGMVKMYKGEVLAKLPIMQHFLFGQLLLKGTGGDDGGQFRADLPAFESPSMKQRQEAEAIALQNDDDHHHHHDVTCSHESTTKQLDTATPAATSDRPIVKWVTGPSGSRIPIYAAHHADCNHGDSIREDTVPDAGVAPLTGVYALGQEAPTCCGMRVPSAIAAKALEQQQEHWRAGMIPFD